MGEIEKLIFFAEQESGSKQNTSPEKNKQPKKKAKIGMNIGCRGTNKFTHIYYRSKYIVGGN